jgi:hypothetical protein
LCGTAAVTDGLVGFLKDSGAVPTDSEGFAEAMARAILDSAGTVDVDYTEFEAALRQVQTASISPPPQPPSSGRQRSGAVSEGRGRPSKVAFPGLPLTKDEEAEELGVVPFDTSLPVRGLPVVCRCRCSEE